MNLHILPDSKFTEAFYLNMKEAGLLGNNTFVIRSNQKVLKYIKQQIPFAPLYSAQFLKHTGDTSGYTKVFIHQFAPLMYRWVAKNTFKEIHWMSWGTDLYNLPFVKTNFYEPETLGFMKKSRFDVANFLYIAKVYLTNIRFKNRAYAKVKSMLTWMASEVEFARAHISGLNSSHQYFFYENQVPYERIDEIVAQTELKDSNAKLKLIVGNSGTPPNNHVDAIRELHACGIKADLYIPVSYGDAEYIRFLKASVSFYQGGEIFFMDELMDFEKYVRFLHSADGLVMNHIRPQGYGNIFMMMYMNRPVFFNEKNISLSDLNAAGLRWNSISQVKSLRKGAEVSNRQAILSFLSHGRLLEIYRGLFA